MTYLYETLTAREGEVPKRYEIKQAANEATLTQHPETGEPIRRVILGGWGLKPGKEGAGSSVSGGSGCGPKGCC
jgi:predicted nucleic acid-binding Zn ribbon protein